MLRIAFTVDVEHDCPPFRTTYRGITEGLPKLVELLDQEKIPATFFVTGDVAIRYPEAIEDLVRRGHEIGCHGHTHQRFDRISEGGARAEIGEATQILRKFYPVVSFRGPNLKFPKPFLKYLKEEGYTIDSTLAKHKNPFVKIVVEDGITRIPVSTTSIVIRSPFLRRMFLSRLQDPVVLFVHPWEFVDLRGEKLRLDCRFRTGPEALDAVRETIALYRSMNATFCRLKDLLEK